METLEYTVRKVYSALKDTEEYISRRYNYIEPWLPDDIFFITSQELEDMFPDNTPKEREHRIAKAKGAVFISLIGKGCEDRASLPFQKALLNGELPYTVGGGIGQSRICMYYLRKAHIGEVHSSIWPDEIMETALDNGIQLL